MTTSTTLTTDRAGRGRRGLAALAGLLLVLSGCSAGDPEQEEGPTNSEQSSHSAPASTPTPTPSAPAGLEDTDFANMDWQFRLGGTAPDTEKITLVDGKGSAGGATYTLGEVVLTELNDDDRVDAVVQLTRVEGNGVDAQWYLWIATDAGPSQVLLPAARAARCGTAVHSVKAVGGGGVEIHESRRGIGDGQLPCSESGTDERVRVVKAAAFGPEGGYLPVQTAPVVGFGGICPVAAEYESWPHTATLRTVPHESQGQEVDPAKQGFVFTLEPAPVYEQYPGWTLIGTQKERVMGCAWAKRG